MSVDDPYYIPSVPRYRVNLTEDLDDTIGDDFFFNGETVVASPLFHRPAKPPVGGSRQLQPACRPISFAPKENKTESSAVVNDPKVEPAKPPLRGGRRSLLKPGRPSISSVVNAKENKPAEIIQKEPVKPPLGGIPHLVSSKPTCRPISFAPKENKTESSAVINDPKVEPAKPPLRGGRRSLLKPGRPSIGSMVDAKENKPAEIIKPEPVKLRSGRQLLSTPTCRPIGSVPKENKTESSTVVNDPKVEPVKPPLRGGRRSLLKPGRPSIGSVVRAKENKPAEIIRPEPVKPLSSKPMGRPISSMSKESKLVTEHKVEPIKPFLRSGRRSFMDNTISFTSKLTGTPSKKG